MKMGKSIRGALSYNEQKVSSGTADLILASHFSRDVSDMGFTEKMLRFEKLTQLNEKSKTNTLHLSLNFSPEDKLDTATMQKIASDYMDRIGFGKQPYLVYQHNDTAHPHLHIVTTTIRQSGKAIYLHNIGRNKSEPARKAIEQEYGLVKAQGRSQANYLAASDKTLEAAVYGKAETKRVISNIVREIAGTYKYTSLDQFNAVLRYYRVVADTGAEGTRMRMHGGLKYSLLDEKGNKIGVPIKASSIYSSPTLSNLQKKMQASMVKKAGTKETFANTVKTILNDSAHRGVFIQALRKNQIRCQFVASSSNTDASIFFIDYRRKLVFTSNELGITDEQVKVKLLKHQSHATPNQFHVDNTYNKHFEEYDSSSLLKTLFASERVYDEISPEFLKKRKKKRRKP